MLVETITRQSYFFASPIPSDVKPRNFVGLDRDSDSHDFYILCLEPTKREPHYETHPGNELAGSC